MSRMAASKASISFWPLSCVLMQMVLPLRQWSRSPLNPSHGQGKGVQGREQGRRGVPPHPAHPGRLCYPPTFIHAPIPFLLYLLSTYYVPGIVLGGGDRLCKKTHASRCRWEPDSVNRDRNKRKEPQRCRRGMGCSLRHDERHLTVTRWGSPLWVDAPSPGVAGESLWPLDEDRSRSPSKPPGAPHACLLLYVPPSLREGRALAGCWSQMVRDSGNRHGYNPRSGAVQPSPPSQDRGPRQAASGKVSWRKRCLG